MKYTKEKTSQISFPLGGIGAGCIGFSGNGHLVDWEIFNRPNKGYRNGFTHFGVRTEDENGAIDFRILKGDVAPPYLGDAGANNGFHEEFGFGVQKHLMAGWPHFREHEFTGEYPFASVKFGEKDFAADCTLHGWSPFIPGNSLDSSIPCACIEVELKNNTDKTVKYTVTGVLTNPWNYENSYNCVNDRTLTVNSGISEDDINFGDLSLSLLDDSCEFSFQEYWYRGDWFDHCEMYFNDLRAGGKFLNRNYEHRREFGGETCADHIKSSYDHGLLAAHFELAAGESRIVPFSITWNVPNCENYWDKNIDEITAKYNVTNRWKNFYSTQWKNSKSSAKYVADNYERMKSETLNFKNSLFSSTLPKEALDGISSNISTLKSPTCLRLEDGTFWGWEGSGSSVGSCEGSCSHVWGYAQALAFLFPDLERSMRDAHLNRSVDEHGCCNFRIGLPLGAHFSYERPCIDGQYGDIMKIYREWKISGDDQWLKNWYPTVRKMVEFAWSKENIEQWDINKSGVMTGRQHHTLDMELFGPNSWLNGYWLGALLATSKIAKFVGDDEFATECLDIYKRGKEWTDKNLFNGEFYHQLIDLKDKSILEKYNAIAMYWNEESKEIKYQIGEGCVIDAVLPQLYGDLYGIGEIYDPAQTRSTLQTIYKNNFKKSMREICNVWRVFSVNDESGVMICSWPDVSKKPAIPLPYSNETMHGFEWSFACLLIINGMIKEGMEIVKSIRSHYDGAKRNPWNEIECGSNYARSMASYGLLASFSGFQFDRGNKSLGFKPVVDNELYKTFWSLGDVWGTYEQTANTAKLEVKFGCLDLQQISLPFMAKTIMFNGKKNEFTASDNVHSFSSAISIGRDEIISFIL